MPRSTDVVEVIEFYRPLDVDDRVWRVVAPEVRRWVILAKPPHWRRALHLLQAASKLVLWCHEHDVPVIADAALRHTTIERFIATGLADFKESTRNTIRSRLLHLSRSVCTPKVGNLPAAPRLRRARVKAPYEPELIDQYLALADAQATARRRNGLAAIVLLGAGAGLSANEMRYVTGNRISFENGLQRVRLERRTARWAFVLARYTDRLQNLATVAGSRLLLGGESPERRDATAGLLSSIDGGQDLPPLEVGRLRSTWIVEHLTIGTRLDVLMEAAGLKSSTSITDLVRYVPAMPQAQKFSQLRGER